MTLDSSLSPTNPEHLWKLGNLMLVPITENSTDDGHSWGEVTFKLDAPDLSC